MAPVAPCRTPISGVCTGQVLGPVPRRPALTKVHSPTTRPFRRSTPAARKAAASRHWSTAPRATAPPSSTRACGRAMTSAFSSSRRQIPGTRERTRGIRARATTIRGQDRGGEFGGGSSATGPLMTGGRRLSRRRIPGADGTAALAQAVGSTSATMVVQVTGWTKISAAAPMVPRVRSGKRGGGRGGCSRSHRSQGRSPTAPN